MYGGFGYNIDATLTTLGIPEKFRGDSAETRDTMSLITGNI
jgi:hypothetical protein